MQHLLLARVRELALDEARHDDGLVLEALGLVDGHQLHAFDLDPADCSVSRSPPTCWYMSR